MSRRGRFARHEPTNTLLTCTRTIGSRDGITVYPPAAFCPDRRRRCRLHRVAHQEIPEAAGALALPVALREPRNLRCFPACFVRHLLAPAFAQLQDPIENPLGHLTLRHLREALLRAGFDQGDFVRLAADPRLWRVQDDQVEVFVFELLPGRFL